MPQRDWGLIYIDRDPTNPYKGWGWIEVHANGYRKFHIRGGYPKSYEEACARCREQVSERAKYPANMNLPSRGRGGTNKFIVDVDGEQIAIRAQKSLTVKAVSAWVSTWAPPTAKIITPGKRAISLEGDKTPHPHFVYFILNEDSNAIKIGHAKDVTKRLKALQTSSPAHLKLLKTIQTEGSEAAAELEQSLHKQFWDLRLAGEWFKAHASLREYVEQA